MRFSRLISWLVEKPAKLVFKRVPRLQMRTDVPCGPRVQPMPDPLQFIRIPGASLIDFRNLTAMTPYPLFLLFTSLCSNHQPEAFRTPAISRLERRLADFAA